MGWYRIQISPAQKDGAPERAVRDWFTQRQNLLIVTEGATVFAGDAAEDGKSYLYFSPLAATAAKPLLAVYGATACKRPSLKGLRLLVGEERSARVALPGWPTPGLR